MEKKHHSRLLFCSKKDITKWISLVYAPFNKCYKALSNKIPLDKMLLLYEALVVSVMMYNSSCWASPKSVLEKLDVVHRRHLGTDIDGECWVMFCEDLRKVLPIARLQ